MFQVVHKALTHGGKFHADDVFSAALLTLLNPKIEITRGFEIPPDFDGLVFDLGGGAFDHHQSSAEVRENGVPYAAFGLLWRTYGAALLGEEDAARFDDKFVQPLDLDDNTGCGDPIAAIITCFNPGWDSDASPDACFAQAVTFATTILNKKLESTRGISRARALVEDALTRIDCGVVVLDRFAPWKFVLTKSDAQFVVYPSQRGGYSAQCVPADCDGPEVLKCPFPAEWAGKSADELQRMNGVKTLRFCHNSRFLIAAGTLEDTVSACRFAQRAQEVAE